MVDPANPAKPVPATQAADDKTVSPSEFLQTYSLYRKATARNKWHFPGKLQWFCEPCKTETTWTLRSNSGGTLGYGLVWGSYNCGLCEKNWLTFYVYSGDEEVYKVGQHPEPSIAIPRRLEKGLKDSAQHYKRALICFNQGYGIAAVAYFRRVVEERTNELIDVVAQLAEANGSSGEEIKKILAAKSERTYDKRLEVASQVIPQSLRPGGVNPLGRLHDLLSDALHGKSEEGSLKTAEEMRFIIEHVFSNLKEYTDAQRTYAKKVQNAGKG